MDIVLFVWPTAAISYYRRCYFRLTIDDFEESMASHEGGRKGRHKQQRLAQQYINVDQTFRYSEMVAKAIYVVVCLTLQYYIAYLAHSNLLDDIFEMDLFVGHHQTAVIQCDAIAKYRNCLSGWADQTAPYQFLSNHCLHFVHFTYITSNNMWLLTCKHHKHSHTLTNHSQGQVWLVHKSTGRLPTFIYNKRLHKLVLTQAGNGAYVHSGFSSYFDACLQHFLLLRCRWSHVPNWITITNQQHICGRMLRKTEENAYTKTNKENTFRQIRLKIDQLILLRCVFIPQFIRGKWAMLTWPPATLWTPPVARKIHKWPSVSTSTPLLRTGLIPMSINTVRYH